MQPGLTYIAMLLDRSGSMAGSEAEVIDGANAFIAEQRKVSGDARLTVARFDEEYETLYEDADIRTARLLTRADFEPRGSTALCDAMNRLLSQLDATIARAPEAERPEHVVVLVFSDGAENASTEVSADRIRARISSRKTDTGWRFLFFGMDIDALQAGEDIGVKGLRGTKGAGGIQRSAKAASAYVGATRLGDQKTAIEIYDASSVDDARVASGVAKFQTMIELPRLDGDDDDAR
jgi:hypothetical protein